MAKLNINHPNQPSVKTLAVSQIPNLKSIDLKVKEVEFDNKQSGQQNDVDSSITKEIKEYKERGIDYLSPEIIFSSEFLPIIKSKNLEPGLQIKNGSKKVNVNQVFKIIELHHSVQKAINDLSLDFVNTQLNIDFNSIYEEASNEFDDDLIKNNFKKTMDAFVKKLESNLIKDTNSSTQRKNAKSTSQGKGNLTNRLVKGKFRDKFSNERNSKSKSTRRTVKYVSFRNLLLEGTEIQKKSIKRILELVILEKLSNSLFGYFSKIIDLKEEKIPFYLDIKNVDSANRRSFPGSAKDDSTIATKRNIKNLKNNYKEVPKGGLGELIDESTETMTIASYDAVETNINNAIENVSTLNGDKGAFHNLTASDIAKKVLSVESLNNLSNYEIIYLLINNIFNSLLFKNTGAVKPDLSTNSVGIPSKLTVEDSNGIKIKNLINNFLENVCVSSFILGNTQKVRFDGESTYTNTYTSFIVNKNTIERNGKFEITGITERSGQVEVNNDAEIAGLSKANPPGKSFSNAEIANNTDNLYTNLEYTSELLGVTLFDLVYTMNRRRFSTDSFGSRYEDLNTYASKVLGNSWKSNERESGFIDFLSFFEEIESGKIDNKLGELGKVLFKNRTIDNLSVLPGNNNSYLNTPSYVNGEASIPFEAFYYNSLSTLEEYVSEMEGLFNKITADVDGLFGTLIESSNVFGGFKNSSPDELLEKILSEFANNLKLLINHIDNYNSSTYTSERFRTAYSLFSMICAGLNTSVLNSNFTCTLLRSQNKMGVLPNSSTAWKTAMNYDAASRSLYQIFNKMLGKTLQYVTYSKNPDGESVRNGQYNNYFSSQNDDDTDWTFINKKHFNGSAKFLGRSLNEGESDLKSKNKIGFRSFNSKEYLGDKVEDFYIRAEGNIAIDPINVIYDYVKEKDSSFYRENISYESIDGDGITDYQYKGRSQATGQGSNNTSSSVAYVLNKDAERPGKLSKNDSLFETNNVHKEYAIFATLCKLVSKSLTVKVTFNKDNKKLYLTYSKKQLCALYDAIKKDSKPEYSKNFNKNEYNAEIKFMETILAQIRKPIIDRENKIKKSLATLYSHTSALSELKSYISNKVSSASLSKEEKLAINYYGLSSSSREAAGSNNNDAAIIDPSIASMPVNTLSYISSKSYPTMYKNFINNILPSKQNLMFSPKYSITNRQIYQMQLAFNREKYGYMTDEKLGKKSILSVGIPARQIKELSLQASIKNGDSDYFDSPYICVHIFKKNMLGENVLYYPKPFIFNTRLESYENIDNRNVKIETPDHENNYEFINTHKKLLDNFSLYSYKTSLKSMKKVANNKLENLLQHDDDLSYINSLDSSGNKQTVIKEMKRNHMIDYYAKMYMRLTTGIDISEPVFPLHETSKIDGDVDEKTLELFEMYRDNLFLKYPSINVDPILAREFLRLEKNIASSRYFTLDKKIKNIMGPKIFDKVYSMIINEADFVVYPYSEILSGLATSGQKLNSFSQEYSAGGQAFINSLSDLYGENTCPYFALDGKQQIIGVNEGTLSSLVQSFGEVNSIQFPNTASETKKDLYKGISGRQKSLIKHINEVQTENVADVYEFFAVVTSIRRK